MEARGDPRREGGRAAHESGRARPQEEGARKCDGKAGQSRGKGGIYGRGEKQRGSVARPLPDRAAAKIGGPTLRLRLLA